ncbi:Uncharacterized protein ToN1_25170 [Aromatoleum petrolei]|nr:Uncharacterized protein ToN1_25170 [Aromatoleum petrolei]
MHDRWSVRRQAARLRGPCQCDAWLRQLSMMNAPTPVCHAAPQHGCEYLYRVSAIVLPRSYVSACCAASRRNLRFFVFLPPVCLIACRHRTKIRTTIRCQ